MTDNYFSKKYKDDPFALHKYIDNGTIKKYLTYIKDTFVSYLNKKSIQYTHITTHFSIIKNDVYMVDIKIYDGINVIHEDRTSRPLSDFILSSKLDFNGDIDYLIGYLDYLLETGAI